MDKQKFNVEYDGFFKDQRASHGTLMVEAKNQQDAQSVASSILAQRFTNFKITNCWRA